jgi:hypothetical protein
MRLFTAEHLCVSVEDIDFIDPNRPEQGRERGVRVELRTVADDTEPGSIYVSRGVDVGRAVCRFDFLESAPEAQDRMHWHPAMADGEPETRVFDDDLRTDPIGFLGSRLSNGVELLKFCGVPDAERFAADSAALADVTDAIIADVDAALTRIRRDPWQPVDQRDERGMPLRA